MQSESQLQCTVVQLLRTLYPDILPILSLSGTALYGTTKQRSSTIAQWKKEGWQAGLPDLSLAIHGGESIHLELKHPNGKGKQSLEQLAVQQQLINLGHNYYLVNSISQVMSIIAEHTLSSHREHCFNQLTSGLTDPLSEQFLHFSSGTPLSEVNSLLRTYYHLTNKSVH